MICIIDFQNIIDTKEITQFKIRKKTIYSICMNCKEKNNQTYNDENVYLGIKLYKEI